MRVNIFFAGIAALLSGCASMSTMQTARTNDKGQFTGFFGGGAVNSDLALGELDTISISAPFLEVGGRYGVSDKLDVGLKLAIIGTAVADAKYQFLGTKESKFAGSIGLGLGYLSVSSDDSKSKIFDVMTPAYFSYHPNDWFSLYTSPRYVLRINSYTTETDATGSSTSNWYGVTGGMRIGRKFAFLGEYSYFKNDEIDTPFSQITAGFGFTLD
jgi:hypothetical protein